METRIKKLEEVVDLAEEDIQHLEQIIAVLTSMIVELAKEQGIPRGEMRQIIEKSLTRSQSEWIRTEFLKMMGYYDETKRKRRK